MNDVAILTKYYKNYNYGGMLQGYALYKVIIDMGKSCEIVSYDVGANPNPIYDNIFRQCSQYGIGAAVQKCSEKIIGKCKFLIRDILNERVELFHHFMDWVDAGTKVYSDANLNELNEKYRVFVSGSDQVWNPNAVRNLYLQNFVDSGNKRVSYAASIGRAAISQHEADILIPALDKFDTISVREKTAKKLLQSHITKEIVTVLDPTMLLSCEEWDRMAAPRMLDQPYALFYFFSDSLRIRKRAEKFCKSKGVKMVLIPYAKQEFNLTDGCGACIRLSKVGPTEFISAIKYADYVFTDSFHGAVFSIIYNKQFMVFERNKSGHVSMNSRLYDLLETFDLGDRMVNVTNSLMDLDEINYVNVNEKLCRLKRFSRDYLENALKK